MRPILYILFALGVLSQTMGAQGVGTWTSYQSYYNTTLVAEAGDKVFAVANGSLYSYGKEDQNLRFYDKQTGLNDNDITNIGYNQDTQTLLVVYSDGNIDLMNQNTVYNLPYLFNSTSVGDKTVNSIYFHNEYAYLSMNFGIIVVNTRKNEIADTYRLDEAINSTCVLGERIYACVGTGLLSASMDDNLLDPGVWESVSLDYVPFRGNEIEKIDVFQNRLCLLVQGQGVYYLDSDTPRSLCANNSINGMKVERDKLLAYTGNGIYICTSLTQVKRVTTGTTNDVSCQNTSDTYWVAAGADGLVGMRLRGDQMEVSVSQLIALEDSPKRNFCDFMTFQQGKLLVAGGGRGSDRFNRPGTFMIHENDQWTNFDENLIAGQSNVRFSDVTSAAVDPNDPEHYFVSTWGEGVFEFQGNEYVKLHNRNNSSLESATADASLNYTRVEGLCYDREGNLWMTNTAISGCVKVLKNDGTWTELKSAAYNVLNNQAVVDKILITSRGDKWVNILRGEVGIVVFNDNGTIDDTSDDVVNKFSSFNMREGETISASAYYCMAEDQQGNIWIGTDKGPIICPVPDRAIDNPESIYCSRIVRDIQDNVSNYFLDNIPVTSIAVDGGNRKWLGTDGSGVFLVNEDGSETLESFTTENSPLLSNTINSIAIDDETGEVFFGTENGIISYMSDASEGKEDYSEVYAYPNPVRPEYNQVTITGLMAESNVKITDMNGNIIYQAKSNGGQLTWNCQRRGGGRVASGVYLVLAATPEAKESVVTKIIVIK